ncbi:MAG: glycosyltransferase involved in cell wall biosynthesis, partial [Dokdonia sp.]
TVVSVRDHGDQSVAVSGKTIYEVLEALGQQFEDFWIYFSNEMYAHSIPFDDFKKYLRHHNTLLTAGPRCESYMTSDIGYVEDGPFITTGKGDIYPTWQMTDRMGVMHSSLLKKIPKSTYPRTQNFVYWLQSIAIQLRPQGLCCYRMYMDALPEREGKQMSTLLLYRFVSEHYKKRWTLLLLMSHMLFDGRFPLYAFAKAQLYKKKELEVDFDTLEYEEPSTAQSSLEVDVIIPTIGREKYLHDVLKDLSAQTIVPKNIIIVEQDQDPGGITALNYLTTESWPFALKHHFIHETGACNARNIAIAAVQSPWVLFFDDDIRCPPDLIEEIAKVVETTKAKAITLACLQQGEVEQMKAFKQWESFGSGCSVVHKEVLDNVRFDTSLEHGYGEDVDFGIQIRQAGYDVLYAPQIQLEHLKAPVGGFRQPHIFPWQDDDIQPKPSPQIMYHRQKNYTPKQLLGYKLVLFLKAFRSAKSINPFAFYTLASARWEASKIWAAKL